MEEHAQMPKFTKRSVIADLRLTNKGVTQILEPLNEKASTSTRELRAN